LGALTLDLIPRNVATSPASLANATHAAIALKPVTKRTVHFNIPRTSASASERVTLIDVLSELAARAAFPIVFVVALIALVRCAGLTLTMRATILARRRVTRIEPPLAHLPEIHRAYEFASSSTATTPHVLGFGRPLVVLPAGLLARSREDIRGVIVHELAHVRRYDDVRAVIDSTLSALFWWNPGIRFALARCARVRERICDDAAVSEIQDRLGYATVLADIARGVSRPPLAVPCFSTRGTVLERIDAILDRNVDRSPRPDGKHVAAAIAFAMLIVFAAARIHVPVSAASSAAAVSEPQGFPSGYSRHLSLAMHGSPVLPQIYRGTWTLAPCGRSHYLRLQIAFDAESAAGSEQWDDAGCFSATEFRGISEITLASISGEHSFSVVRPAGTFDATGHFASGKGVGTYAFVPSEALSARIKALGHGSPTLDQLFALAITDFQSSELDALATHGYTPPTPDELTQLVYVDADPNFVQAAIDLPATTKTVPEILKLRQSGFPAGDIVQIQALGFHPTLEQFIRLAQSGARPEWIASLRAGGYKGTSVEELIQLRQRGG
jgi:beta-lactamase regulating signal transducer with metallopeptidase domain